MDERIPGPVQPIIGRYLLLANKQLPDLINAIYIIGSIALGEFNDRFSDIDFITLLNRKISPAELEKLRDIHNVIAKIHPRWKMSGSYIQLANLGAIDNKVLPHPHYHDGILHPNERSELNLVTWWELRNHGIAIMDTTPQNFSFTVDWNLLIVKMRENMNSYWASWTKQPRRILVMYSDWGIQWTVLGVLRQFYTFRENRITTKVRAAEYSLDCLPARWHQLIREAINIREGKRKTTYRFQILRTIEAVNFLSYIIQICNAGFDPITLHNVEGIE